MGARTQRKKEEKVMCFPTFDIYRAREKEEAKFLQNRKSLVLQIYEPPTDTTFRIFSAPITSPDGSFFSFWDDSKANIVYASEGPIQEAIALDPDIAQNTYARDLYEIGKNFEYFCDYLNASLTFQLLTKLDPGNTTVWHAAAKALVKCKNYNKALEACNTTLLLNPLDD